ncbi:MAG: hypothetical protein WC839_04135 [Candidatus Paceibacterota bacterium]
MQNEIIKKKLGLKEIFLLSITIILGVYMLFISNNNMQHPVFGSSIQEQNSVIKKLESKVDIQGTVTIEITPIEFSSEVSEWKFNVGLNTHSLELDQDMTKVSALFDENGKEYKPIRWEGSVSGGHHREGILIFKSIIPMPKFIELKIIDIDAPVRSFVWDIIN